MALLWIDSFDHYDDAQIADKYEQIGGTPNIDAVGRFGSGLVCVDGSTQEFVEKTFTAASSIIVGFAVQIVTLSAADKPLCEIVTGSTVHVTLNYQTSTGRLYLIGPGGTLGTSTPGLSADVWYYVEVKVTIGNSAAFEVRVNELSVISGTGDTQNGATTTADRVRLRAGSGSGTSTTRRFDDFYIADTSGGAPTNDYLGDIRVEAIFPNGNGNTSNLTGSDGNSTDNYLLVDETLTINDADYVESNTVGNKDTYAYTNVTPTTGTVYGLQPVLRAAKTDAGARSVASVARHSGSETDGTNQALSTTTRYYADVRETKPGGGAWSISDVNGAEFGVKVTV